MKKSSLFALMLLFISCQSRDQKSDRCQCDEIANLGNQIDSVRQSSTSNFEADGNLAIDAEIKKIIDVEGQVGVNFNNYNEMVKNTVNIITDKFPEITNLTRFELDFHCRFIQSICQDNSLSENEFNRLKADNLKSIHNLIQNLYLEKIKINSSKTIKNKRMGDVIKENPKNGFEKGDQPNIAREINSFELTIIINSGDRILINGKPANFINGNSSNVKKIEILEGERYEIIIGNCDPFIIPKVSKNEKITRCS